VAVGESRPVCVVGAGVAGLLAARRLLERDLAVEVVERRPGLGGLWRYDPGYGGVYPSAHLISSRHSTELPDFPMPAGYPDYPGHEQALAYLHAFAARYDLTEHITFGRSVRCARPVPAGGWEIEFDDGDRRDYAALVVASGHHWDPRPAPVDPAGFDGTVLHSAGYRGPEVLAGARVLVVGLGNTACDVAVDAVNAGARVTLSVRGGAHVIPKYLLGLPADQASNATPVSGLVARLPDRARAAIEQRLIRRLAGAPEDFGLPRPDHRLYQRQPLVSTLLPYHLGHGDIRVRPPVSALRAGTAHFADGSTEPADVVVWCTGYRVTVPFLDVRAVLGGDEQGRPRLWLNMFNPGRPDVVAVGLVDALGSWPVLDLQARLAAEHLRGVLHPAGGHPVPAPPGTWRPAAAVGPGPDRHWLFQGRWYARHLRQVLRRR